MQHNTPTYIHSKLILTSFLLCISALCTAQHRYVVVDMETRVPQRDVMVSWDGDNEARTLWDGSFTINEVTDSIVLYKPGYVTRIMKPDELTRDQSRVDSKAEGCEAQFTDTITLLPTFNKLGEVVIYGKDKRAQISFSLEPLSKEEIAMIKASKPGISVDVMESIRRLFTWKKRKRQRRTKAALEKY